MFFFNSKGYRDSVLRNDQIDFFLVFVSIKIQRVATAVAPTSFQRFNLSQTIHVPSIAPDIAPVSILI